MKVTFAFSPCPNDTFMFEPIVSKRIDTEGLDFEFHLADVEELNKAAFTKEFDVTKLSFNAFTKLTQSYQLLSSGSALGQNCGPLLISKRQISNQDLANCKVGIPGINTTANFLLSFAHPEIVKKQELLFSDIESSLLNDEIDAGVIIHENRFTYSAKGLREIKDLGAHWEQETGFPIPLGGIAVKREKSEEVKAKINRVIAKSVAYAMDHPASGIDFIRFHSQEMEEEVLHAHIKLYVNKFSRDIGGKGKSSIDFLFENHPEVEIKDIVRPLFIEN